MTQYHNVNFSFAWMFLSEWCTSSASWCSTACTVKRLRTSWNCATSHWCCITATSLIHHPTAPGCTMPPAQLLWPTGFLPSWPVGLEFPARRHAESNYWQEQFQTISENVSVCNILMHPANWRFHDDALYKSTFYLLTYFVKKWA